MHLFREGKREKESKQIPVQKTPVDSPDVPVFVIVLLQHDSSPSLRISSIQIKSTDILSQMRIIKINILHTIEYN